MQHPPGLIEEGLLHLRRVEERDRCNTCKFAIEGPLAARGVAECDLRPRDLEGLRLAPPWRSLRASLLGRGSGSDDLMVQRRGPL